MKKILCLLSISLLVCCKSTTHKEGKYTDSKTEALFLIHGKKGVVQLQPTVQLVLEDVDESVAYITSKGHGRRAGKISLEQFLDSYAPKFRNEEQPTAAYIFYDHFREGDYSETPIRVSNPIFNKRKKTLTFHIDFLSQAAVIEQGPINEVTLFIDDYVPEQQ